MSRHHPCLLLTILLLLAICTPLLGQADSGNRVETLVREGIALHDQGRYDEAAARYRKALELEPRSELALYELAFAFDAAGKFGDCVMTAEDGIDLAGEYLPLLFTLAGNCLDKAGEPRKAAKMYRRGLRKAPDHPMLAFNFAITLAHQNKYEEATKYAKLAIDNAPTYASAHWLLAAVYADSGFAVPALLATFRFLTLEPTGARSQPAAQTLVALLNRGITQQGESEIEITLDPDPPKEEGDFKSAEMILALSGALRFTEEGEKKNELESYVHSLETLVEVLSEDPTDSWVDRTYSGFFIEAQRAGKLEALARMALSSLGLPGSREWLGKNTAQLEDMVEWLQTTQDG